MVDVGFSLQQRMDVLKICMSDKNFRKIVMLVFLTVIIQQSRFKQSSSPSLISGMSDGLLLSQGM